MELKGSKTEANLWEAFAGESQARNCGHLEYGDKAPDVCPVCSHPQAFFEVKAENY